ncbi:glycosyltransferase family 2 protein [Candidatus Woesearchaeota archaeon]|nr:glycosyltransferase family 2 protein [Candidatus Woesearchaeota archaeon]
MKKNLKITIAIPARNSEKTIKQVYSDLAPSFRNNAILSDDKSTDKTRETAKKLGIKVFQNPREPGYGSNVKNCFNMAIKEKADVVVILHSDNQYDPKKVPELVKPILDGEADFTIGSRILGDKASGMSTFRFTGNRLLGFFENLAMGTNLTDLHSGMVAIKADLLRKIPFNSNSDDYGFHTDIVLQSHYIGARFKEIGIPTRYEDISTSISVYRSIIYGFRTMQMVMKYLLHKYGLMKFKEFRIKMNEPNRNL